MIKQRHGLSTTEMVCLPKKNERSMFLQKSRLNRWHEQLLTLPTTRWPLRQKQSPVKLFEILHFNWTRKDTVKDGARMRTRNQANT